MRGYWKTRKTASLHELTYHATSFQKLQKGHQGMHFINTARKNNLNRKPVWPARALKVNVIASFYTRTTSIGKRAGAKPNVLTDRTASTKTPSSTSYLSPYASNIKASTNCFDSCRVCFDRQNRLTDCWFISGKQKKQLLYLRGFNLRGPYPRETVTHGEPSPAYRGARRAHRHSNRNTPSSRTAKQPETGKH